MSRLLSSNRARAEEGQYGPMPKVPTVGDNADRHEWRRSQRAGDSGFRSRCSGEDHQRRPGDWKNCVPGRIGHAPVEAADGKSNGSDADPSRGVDKQPREAAAYGDQFRADQSAEANSQARQYGR